MEYLAGELQVETEEEILNAFRVSYINKGFTITAL